MCEICLVFIVRAARKVSEGKGLHLGRGVAYPPPPVIIAVKRYELLAWSDARERALGRVGAPTRPRASPLSFGGRSGLRPAPFFPPEPGSDGTCRPEPVKGACGVATRWP